MMTTPIQIKMFPDGDGRQRLGVAGACRRTDPETSREAAASVNAASLEGMVYTYLLAHGPCILDEVVNGMNQTPGVNLDKVTVSPRFKPLKDKGYIELTGIERIPKGKTRKQQEWKAMPGKELIH